MSTPASRYAATVSPSVDDTADAHPARRQSGIAHRWGGGLVSEGLPEDQPPTVKQIAETFIANTTAHGVPRVFEKSSSPARRVVWLLCCLTGAGMWLYLSFDTMKAYREDHTAFSVHTAPSGTLPTFPAVTVCPAAPFRCDCGLWYSDTVLDNLRYTYPLLSFYCPGVLSHALTYAEHDPDTSDADSAQQFMANPALDSQLDFQTDPLSKINNVAKAIRAFKKNEMAKKTAGMAVYAKEFADAMVLAVQGEDSSDPDFSVLDMINDFPYLTWSLYDAALNPPETIQWPTNGELLPWVYFTAFGIDENYNSLSEAPYPMGNFTLKEFVALRPTVSGVDALAGMGPVLELLLGIATDGSSLAEGFDMCPLPLQTRDGSHTTAELAEAAAARAAVKASIEADIQAQRPVAVPRRLLQEYAGRTCPDESMSVDSRNFILEATMRADRNGAQKNDVNDVTEKFRPLDHPQYGRCCTLDRGTVRQALPSQSFGLKLVTYIGSGLFPSVMQDPRAGVRVAVHHENGFAAEALSGTDSAFVGAHSRVDIQISSHNMTRAQYPFGSDCAMGDFFGESSDDVSSYGKCYQDCVNMALAENCDEDDVMDCPFQTEMYTFHSSQVEELHFENDIMLDIADGEFCVPPWSEDEPYRYGSRGKSGEQLQKDAEEFPSPDYAFCPVPCEETVFSVDAVHNTASPSTSVKKLNALFLQYNDYPPVFNGELSEAWVYFTSKQVRISTEGRAVPLASLLGTMGGNLGLFLGMSLMTFMEFFEFAVVSLLTVAACCKAGSKKGKQQEKQEQQRQVATAEDGAAGGEVA